MSYEGIRNRKIEEEYERRQKKEEVITYILSPEELARRYGGLTGSGVKEQICYDLDVNKNTMSSDSAKMIRLSLESGMTIKKIVKDYGYNEKHVKKVVSLIMKERN